MKPFEIETALTKMVGQVVNYNRKNQKVLRFELKEKTVRITTDVEDIVLLVEDFHDALPHFLPAEDQTPSIIQQPHADSAAVATSDSTVIRSTSGWIIENLKDNIQRVKRDKEYIPQAAEVVNNVREIINLAKAEIELIKAMRNS